MGDVEGVLLLGFVMLIVIPLIIFLLTREFWCWYWKINENISLQRQILDAILAQDTSAVESTAQSTSGGPSLRRLPSQTDKVPENATPLDNVPQQLLVAYKKWQLSKLEADFTAFLWALNHALPSLPESVTAAQLEATFPSNGRVDYVNLLQSRTP